MVGAAIATSVTGAVAFFTIAYHYRRISGSNWRDFLILRRADVKHIYNSLRNEFAGRGRG
jgi:hypothetical protein